MADAKATNHILRGVTALYPRINRTYKFDPAAGERGKTVPCDAMEEGAKYEINFRMTEAQAKELYAAMALCYADKKQAKWPAKIGAPAEVFRKGEDGSYVGKAVLKGSYGDEATMKPPQYDATNKRLGDDFLLTTGSTVHLQVTFVPYSMRDHGVSLRLRAVQVIDLKPMEEYSPFGAEDGFSIDAAPETISGFEIEDAIPNTRAEEAPAPAPVKKASKKSSPPPKETDDGLADIMADWND